MIASIALTCLFSCDEIWIQIIRPTKAQLTSALPGFRDRAWGISATRAKTETFMADETGKFDIPALGNSAFGIPNRRQFMLLGAGAAAGLIGSSFRICSNGTSGQSARQAARAGDRGSVAGADRLSSSHARHRGRSGRLVAGLLAALVHRPGWQLRARSRPRDPDHREWRALGRRADLEDQAAQRREVA